MSKIPTDDLMTACKKHVVLPWNSPPFLSLCIASNEHRETAESIQPARVALKIRYMHKGIVWKIYFKGPLLDPLISLLPINSGSGSS